MMDGTDDDDGGVDRTTDGLTVGEEADIVGLLDGKIDGLIVGEVSETVGNDDGAIGIGV